VNTDLTVGKPSKILLKYCLPLFISVIFQQCYNLTDSIVCGKLIGNDALAAVGNGFEVTALFTAFAVGCNIGCSVIVAKLFGAKDYKQLKTNVFTSLISTAVLCAVLVTFGLIFCGPLLRLMKTPDEIFDASKSYLDIYILGVPFVFFYNISNGIFNALGDSKTPFYFLVASSIANIGLDILFVAAFAMGVPGVAWATFICQGCSCILAFTFMLRRVKKLPYDGKFQIFSWKAMKEIAAIAVPSILQQSSVSIGNVLIQSIINSFGAATMAGFAAAFKMNSMSLSAFGTFSSGLANYTGQNYGAGKIDRIKEGIRSAVFMAECVAIPLALLMFFFGDGFAYLFLESPTGDAVDMTAKFLKIVGPFYPIILFKFVADNTMRGCGHVIICTVDTLVDLGVRVGLATILSKTALGNMGVPISWPIGWVVGTVIGMWAMIHFLKKTKAQFQKK